MSKLLRGSGEHRESPDARLAARVKAAGALRDDFEREFRSAQKADLDRDWLTWAKNLSAVLGTVLEIMDGPAPAVTLLFPDGGAFLTADDVQLAASALRIVARSEGPAAILFKSLARRLDGAR